MSDARLKSIEMVEDDPLFAQIAALQSLSDDEIDTSEIPVRRDFSSGVRGRFFHLTARDYDVRAIGNWCIRRANAEGKKISNLWLNKMVYFIYEEALTINKILLTSARVEAWDHGPVFREIYFGLKSDDADTLLKSFDVDTKKKVEANEHFEISDLAIFEGVWNRLSNLSGSQLRDMSHKPGEPWHRVWHYAGQSNPGMQIDIATIIGATDHKARGDS